jgi:hypothetical protein
MALNKRARSALGYIREQRVHPNTSDRRIIVTPAGYAVFESANLDDPTPVARRGR